MIELKFEIAAGIVPLRRLFVRSRNFSLDMLKNPSGIEEDKKLLPRFKLINDGIEIALAGSWPVSRLLDRSMYLSELI
jgi:hypothetical protein